jgi:hypothetical protein
MDDVAAKDRRVPPSRMSRSTWPGVCPGAGFTISRSSMAWSVSMRTAWPAAITGETLSS